MNVPGLLAPAGPGPAGVERLRAVAAKRLGLRFDDGKSVFLAEVLQRRLDHTGRRLNDYLLPLEAAAPPPDELRVLAQELTVTETYFFRNAEQLRVLVEVALPARALARPGQLRVLSAGCASGEEPYSVAMMLYDQPEPCPWDVDLQAIDINPAMLNRARQGQYSPWALRETPPDVQARCFRPQGRDFVLDERFRALVTFSERNLIRDDPAFWRPDAFDVVFCRNVMMYFSADVAAGVVARLTRSLAPGGFLFLGYAETLRGLSHDFHLLHTHDTFYYQRRQAWEQAPRPADGVALPLSAWGARERASAGELGEPLAGTVGGGVAGGRRPTVRGLVGRDHPPGRTTGGVADPARGRGQRRGPLPGPGHLGPGRRPGAAAAGEVCGRTVAGDGAAARSGGRRGRAAAAGGAAHPRR